jgi:endo-1,4-beta-xylanase
MTQGEAWTRRQLLGAVGQVAVLTNAQKGSQRGGRAVLVRAFDPSGSPAPDDQLSTLLLVNPDSRPFEVLSQPKGDGTATIEMPKEKFDLAMVLPVRDFGKVYLHSDNNGGGYSAAQVDGRELLLNYEFARSRAGFVRRYVKSAQAEGVNFSSAMMSRLEHGEAALAQATAARETGVRVGHSNDSLAETMWAGEMAAVERARHRIAHQGPRPGFLFGAAAFGYGKSEEYDRQYSALLNYGTVPFYRAATERVEGSPDYRNVDAILAKMAGTQIIAKGHPLVWFHRAGIPEFLKTKSWDELKRSCREYILRSVGRFRGSRIHAWDVINEAHDWANELGFNQDQLLEMTRLAAESTRIADPTAFRVVNCCLPWGEYVAAGRTYAGPLKRPARTPLEYYRAVEDTRVPYEAIGIQVYYPGQDMLEIERQLERFFVFGKPIHITELGVPTSSEGVKGGGSLPYEDVWHGTAWSEAIQADWAEQFYTICYSKLQIQAISWWSFADSSRAGSGLLHPDFGPKESYLRLTKLLASWKQG